jgi:predicted MPP superfamily phosphohydrolase
MFLLNVLGLLIAVSAYIGLRLLPALPIGPILRAVAIAVLCLPVALAATGIIARFLGHRRARLLMWAGSLTLGWVSTLFVLTVLRELVLAVGALAAAHPVYGLIRTGSAVAVPALAALATLLGLRSVLGRPRLLEIPIPLSGLPKGLHGFRIAQISDLHIGATIRRGYVRRIVERVNRLDADLIAITGDLVDGSVEELAPHAAPLAGLRSRHGAWFVTGNHEYYSGVQPWIAQLRRLGIHVLLNEHVVLRHGAAMLLLAGITDPVAQAFDPRQRSDPQAALRGAPEHIHPRILLAHRPGSALLAEPAGFDLQLSGHTHGGQFWPWNLVVRYREPLSIGLDRLNRMWVYTSRGTGFWGPPLRLGVPAEITLLRLVPAEEATAVSVGEPQAEQERLRAAGAPAVHHRP